MEVELLPCDSWSGGGGGRVGQAATRQGAGRGFTSNFRSLTTMQKVWIVAC
eukprot:COSAG02_NODE_44580_length_365_cov_0.563910_1_plen_50_part_01